METHVVEISPVTSRHSALIVFLACILKLSTDYNDAGAVFAAPFIMNCGDDVEMMPDLQIVVREHLGLIADDCLEGSADIAIEIIPWGSDPEDRTSSLADYEQTGVREYWLIDPEHKVATFYIRNAEKQLVPARMGESGIYRSKILPDLWIKVNWLWEDPPPKAMVILREWRKI
ncbi:MAG TPA: Uma2 family endonuclease [Capsulimonadaceae bacterium]|jgi:Uma2 family endonuclease